MKRLPICTAIVALTTAAFSAIALTHPHVLAAMERHPGAVQLAWPWRLLAPLLVHDDWMSLAFNLAGLAIVGAAVERRFGVWKWIALYLAGGIVGELVGMVWQPVGAGNSIACFGLVGGLVAMLLRRDANAMSFVALYGAEWALVYVGLALGGVRGAVVAGVLCGVMTAIVARAGARAGARPESARATRVAVACGTFALALLLCAIRDIHGPPLIAGAMLGMIFHAT